MVKKKISETTYIAGISICNRFSIVYFGFNHKNTKRPLQISARNGRYLYFISMLFIFSK